MKIFRFIQLPPRSPRVSTRGILTLVNLCAFVVASLSLASTEITELNRAVVTESQADCEEGRLLLAQAQDGKGKTAQAGPSLAPSPAGGKGAARPNDQKPVAMAKKQWIVCSQDGVATQTVFAEDASRDPLPLLRRLSDISAEVNAFGAKEPARIKTYSSDEQIFDRDLNLISVILAVRA